MGRSATDSSEHSEVDERNEHERSKEKRRRRHGDDARDGRSRKKDRRSSTRSPSREREERRRGGGGRSRSRSASPHVRHSGRHRERNEREDSSKYRGSNRDRERSGGKSSGLGLNTSVGPPAIDQNDFDQWMTVLATIDNHKDLRHTRAMYSQFLERYPYCYGFWQKFAEWEKRNGNLSETRDVWERGVAAINMSIDLWLGYLGFIREIAPAENSSNQIREIFDQSLATAGKDFNSDRLWLEAIGWEQAQFLQQMYMGYHNANARNVGKLFDQLLATPTAHHQTHLARYAAYINSVEPDLILSDVEYDDLFRMARKSTNKGIDEAVTEETRKIFVRLTSDGKTWAETDEQTAMNDEGARAVSVHCLKHDAEVLEHMRAELLSRRQKIHQATSALIGQRINFETGIKRPYFHVKPLESAQLINWLAYLDLEIMQKNTERTKVLFERCVIACALYEEYWLKYARWMWRESRSESDVRDIYRRALLHVGNSVQLVLARSSFEEARGNFDAATSVLDNFKHAYPGYVVIEMRLIGVQRRRIEVEKSTNYSEVVALYEKLIMDPSASRHLSSFYSIKLARFHLKVRNDPKQAEKVLRKAIERDRDNVQLFMQVIDIAYSAEDFSQTAVVDAFDFALRSDLKLEDKIRISQRKLDFLEELSYDIELLDEHQDYHLMLIGQLPPGTQLRTRVVSNAAIGSRVPALTSVAVPVPTAIWPGQQAPVAQQQQMVQPMGQLVPQQYIPMQVQHQQPIQMFDAVSINRTPEAFNSPNINASVDMISAGGGQQ